MTFRAMLPRPSPRLEELHTHLARDGRHLQRTTRFLWNHVRFDARDDDVFIASYPRSGTTWTQLIVHLVLHEGSLGFRHIQDVVPWYERSLALGQARARDFAKRPAPRAFKSHLLPSWLPSKGRYLYLRRDGLDVAVSFYALYRSHLGLEESFDEFFQRFLRGRLQYRAWFDHVAAWQARRSDPRVLWLEYENLRAEPASSIERIAHFLGVKLNSARLQQVVEQSSLASMRAGEKQFDHATSAPGSEVDSAGAGGFVRQGEVGGGQRVVTAAQREAFFKRLAEPADRPLGLADLPAFLH